MIELTADAFETFQKNEFPEIETRVHADQQNDEFNLNKGQQIAYISSVHEHGITMPRTSVAVPFAAGRVHL